MEVSGHTGFANFGSDTLCAALSGIVQAGALGLQKVLKLQANIIRNDSEGYFLVELPKNLSSENLEKSQIIFLTMLEAVKDLEGGYSKHIKLEV